MFLNLPVNRSVNLDSVFSDNPEGVFNHHQRILPGHLPKGDPELNSSQVPTHPDNVSGTTVVASRSGNR